MKDITDISQVSDFFENLAKVIEQARRFVGRTTDLTMCIIHYDI